MKKQNNIVLKPREAFMNQHECWIHFLEDRDKLNKVNSIHHTWEKDGATDHESDLDLTKLTPYFEEWQTKNLLFDESEIKREPLLGFELLSVGDYKKDLLGSCRDLAKFEVGRFFSETEKEKIKEVRKILAKKVKPTRFKVKYQCEKEFMIACCDWMHQNLKNISRGGKEIAEVGNFGEKEVSALLKGITKEYVPWLSAPKLIHHDYKDTDDSYIPTLARYTDRFLEYVEHVLNGLNGKAKFGIFKVGVCPYHRKNKPECGHVFIGWTWNTEACDEHTKKWRELKRLRMIKQKINEIIKKH